MANANGIKYLAFLVAFNIHANTDPYEIDTLKQMTLNELLELEVITPSRVEQRLIDSPANITVITQSLIRQRGYKNLVEILQDLPGFDFATYEDGGGEYSNHSLNRGIGGNPGNPKLLILVDGIAQNHIGFNWSQLFGEEQLYQDLDRIEVIQGPVSAVYGSNAFSGIIHFITQRKVTKPGTQSTLWLGENNTQAISAFHQSKFDDLHFNTAFKIYKTDGDKGLDRYDPASYFGSNPWPTITTESFDNNGQAQSNSQNPYSGQTLQPGFNTQKDDWSVRANINYFSPTQNKKAPGLVRASAGFYVWNKREGLGSYVPGYEYQTTLDTFTVHHSAQVFSGDFDYRINDKLLSTFSGWYRQNRQLPRTGFQYTYRYPDLVKSYHSLNTLWGLEQQFKWQLDNNDLLLVGLRFISTDKMDQVVSLGEFQDGHDPVTTSSWSSATTGDNPQLGISERVQVYKPKEQALYGTYDGQLSERVSYSAGLRVDSSDDYGTTANPRVGLIYKVPNQLFTHWNLKFLYGEAFREPSIFELTDEFRGNRALEPEEIKTTEVINQFSWQSQNNSPIESLTLNASFFYSDMENLITLVQSAQSEAGSIYANASIASVRGFSFVFDASFSSQLSFFVNYQYTQGKQNSNWQAVDHTARNKWNLGFNWLTMDDNLNISIRTNILGSRKVPLSNGYYDRYAPGYEKTNLTISWDNWKVGSLRISPQFIVKNVFDEDYAGVGRQDGRSDISEYNPLTNPNPDGFVPGYHPQPGRSILFNVKVEF
jgi:outer membrane receptor for ferrienterochelin and colicins